jgi:hypothetical protein
LTPLLGVGQAADLILLVCQGYPFGAPVALRFVKPSKATLAFTSLGDTTCA